MSQFPAILYENVFDNVNLSASTTETNFDVANIKDWRPFLFWKPTAPIAEQTITVDCGSIRSANSLGIAGHDLFTQLAFISVEYSDDNFASDINVALSAFQPLSDGNIYAEFPIQSARYWRLKIATGYTAAPFIGVLVVGERMQFEDALNVKSNFDPTRHTLVAEDQKLKSGQPVGRALKIREVDLNPKWLHVKTSFVDGPLQTFFDEHEFDPFFWIWDFDNRPNDVFLVRLPPGFVKHFPFISGTAFRNINLKFTGVL